MPSFLYKGNNLKNNYTGTIKNISRVANNVFELKIDSKLESAAAGQFISLLCPNHTFRRPFSIANFENGTITVLIKLQGDGTKYLTSLKLGDNVEFLAPLGNKFETANKNCLLVGAGIGIAPMLFLKKELNKTLIVVVRYFGGTLLGTGLLTRSYLNAANLSTVLE